MVDPQHTTVAILGGGKGGSALLELLTHLPEVSIVGLADKDPSAPGIKRALELQIQVTSKAEDLIRQEGVNLIIDVTGDRAVEPLIQAHRRPGTEVLTGAAARLLWNLVQHQTHIQAQLLSADKLATIGTFASGLAHDINNPLYLIVGLAENLQDERDPAVIKEQAGEIIRTVRRISALSKELMQYARQPTTHDLVDVELTTILDEALKIARFASLLQDLSLVKDYAAKPVIKANPDDLFHIFVNLMTNAIQAMQGKGTLTIGTQWHGELVKVTISDTGCGIPKEDLRKIFEAFYTTKPPGKGTGLGLHNVRDIVTKLHGKISVESEVGKGTTFCLEFPKA